MSWWRVRIVGANKSLLSVLGRKTYIVFRSLPCKANIGLAHDEIVNGQWLGWLID